LKHGLVIGAYSWDKCDQGHRAFRKPLWQKQELRPSFVIRQSR
jgi:hypothetical protein